MKIHYLLALVMILAGVAGCSQPPYQVTLTPTPSRSEAIIPTPTGGVSSSASAVVPSAPTLEQMKGVLARGETLDAARVEFDLQITDDSLKSSREAVASSLPNVYWEFSSNGKHPETFRIEGFSGPASFIMPDLVGKRLADISTVMQIYGAGAAADLLDGQWSYHVKCDQHAGIISATDQSSIGVA